MKIGFDSEKYINLQYEQIMQRINMFSGKLYMEFGGKIFDDLHASRVLPGFDANIKIKLLKKLRHDSEIIIVFNRNLFLSEDVFLKKEVQYQAQLQILNPLRT